VPKAVVMGQWFPGKVRMEKTLQDGVITRFMI
jgi:hypothetical protein